MEPSAAFLLGSPIGDLTSVSVAVEEKTALLRRLGDRLQILNSNDAFVLLRYSLAIPKLLYSLRSAPCFAVTSLCEYDNVLCSVLSSVTNCDMSAHQSAWVQSSLPVKMGGLGIRSAVHLAPSAFLASSAASVSLVHRIILPVFVASHSCFVKKPCLHGPLVITVLLLQSLLFALRNRGTRSDLWQSSTLSLNQLLIYLRMPVFSPAVFENLGPG